MQLEQTQPSCLFGIKYPQVSQLSLYLRDLAQPDAKAWKPPEFLWQFFLSSGSYLYIFYLSSTFFYISLYSLNITNSTTMKVSLMSNGIGSLH